MKTTSSEIEINGVKYIPKSQAKQTEFKGEKKIVILQRGWVMVGTFERKGTQCFLHNSSTIRTWGTKSGLGELAKEGKLPDTILDANNGLVEFDALTIVATISCNPDKW